MDGYAGKILNINLSEGSARDFIVPEDVVHKYIGGKGLGIWLLYNGVQPQIDPMSPDNVLLLMTGPLTGLDIPGVNHMSVVTKSPLTGAVVEASLGGDFAEKLKSCGYDGVILRGKAKRPVIIDITEGRWKIRDATSLWGANVVRTQELLASKVASVICIGPAGENMVRFATIVSGEHTAQRGGTGAVMGSKLVKALRVGGTFQTPIFDKDRLKRPAEAIKNKLKAPGAYPTAGTAGNVELSASKGALPVRSFSMGSFDRQTRISGDALRKLVRRKATGCSGCPISCTNEARLETKSGSMKVKGPGYQGLTMLGSNLLIDDLEAIIRNNYACYLLGLDPVSTGGTIATAMELAEKGRLDLPLKFGSAREVGPLLPLIAERRGPGKELADGSTFLVIRYGYREVAMEVKQMEMAGYDPRGCFGQGLGFATSPAGGSNIGSMMASAELQGFPISIPATKAAGKVRLTIFTQNMFNSLACVGACFRASYCIVGVPDWVKALPGFMTDFAAGHMAGLSSKFVDIGDYYRALSYVTGIRYDRRAFLRAGERVFNLERLFNLREGFTSKDDAIPLRFIGEPFREGPAAGKVVPMTKMLPRYYRQRRWTDVGIPTIQGLNRLGIEQGSAEEI